MEVLLSLPQDCAVTQGDPHLGEFSDVGEVPAPLEEAIGDWANKGCHGHVRQVGDQRQQAAGLHVKPQSQLEE